MQHEDDLMTLPEIAELVRAPLASVRHWRRQGTGPRTFRLNRRVVAKRSDVLSWIDEKRHEQLEALAERPGTTDGRAEASV